MRKKTVNEEEIIKILNHLMKKFPNDWLLTLEICEIMKSINNEIYENAKNHLIHISEIHSKYKKLILDGLKIIS